MFVAAFGPDSNIFIDILAATSPRLQVRANLRLALSIYKAYKEKRSVDLADILGRLMPAHSVNVIRALQGKELSGDKVRRFAMNLKGDLSVVTIDMWICKAYGVSHKRLKPKQYARLEKKIQDEAKTVNLEPAQYQALIWYCVRRKGGYFTDQSFVKHYETLFPEFGLEIPQ